MTAEATARESAADSYTVSAVPYYREVGNEVRIFLAAYENRLPVLLKGPTGCGKTRFVESMAFRLGLASGRQIPIVTVACHEDLTASDLVGRYMLKDNETEWIDGPLSQAVKTGALCYLDEVVEARKDTIVLLHPLTDHRRLLPVERRGTVLAAHEDFQLIISYNPGYQSVLKDLKQSTRQRFVAIEFGYPPEDVEQEVIRHESGVPDESARLLARLGAKVRNLKDYGLAEGASTRLLVYAGRLIQSGLAPREACRAAVAQAVTDDPALEATITELVDSVFPE